MSPLKTRLLERLQHVDDATPADGAAQPAAVAVHSAGVADVRVTARHKSAALGLDLLEADAALVVASSGRVSHLDVHLLFQLGSTTFTLTLLF